MPSSTCGVCNAEFASGIGVINCGGECGKSFHQQCAKDYLEEKKTRSSKPWKCEECRGIISSNINVKCATGTAVTKDFLLSVVEQLKNEVFRELKTFRDEMAEIKVSMDTFSDIVDKTNTLMCEVKKDLAALKKENEALQAKNAALDATVDDLQDRLRSLEQYTRRANIEVSGVPVTPQENVMDIVKDLGAAIGVKMEESTVAAAHRVPSYRRDRTPSLVVQFSTKAERDAWIGKFKEKKTLTADKVNSAFSNTHRVYINEHLSPENKLFLSKLKKRCQEIGYSYVWCREGKFFVRKTNGERCVRVNKLSDINKLK